MAKNENPKKTEKRKALKTFNFWFKVLLGTNLMDDQSHRQEYQAALNAFKKKLKKEVV